jgi:hypothetical protein
MSTDIDRILRARSDDGRLRSRKNKVHAVVLDGRRCVVKVCEGARGGGGRLARGAEGGAGKEEAGPHAQLTLDGWVFPDPSPAQAPAHLDDR